MSKLAPQILIIDNELQIRRLLRASFENQGYRLREATTAIEGMQLATQYPPDAVLLDTTLPDISGLDVIRRLREWTLVPIIVMSISERESDKIAAFEAGIDDYVIKPFSVPELQARLKVALRRANRIQQPLDDTVFQTGELKVDLSRRLVTIGGRMVKITPLEFKVLSYLVKHAGKVLTHQQILREVWGPKRVDQSNYLRVFIYQLRHKLESDPTNPEYITTEGHLGYRLSGEDVGNNQTALFRHS